MRQCNGFVSKSIVYSSLSQDRIENITV